MMDDDPHPVAELHPVGEVSVVALTRRETLPPHIAETSRLLFEGQTDESGPDALHCVLHRRPRVGRMELHAPVLCHECRSSVVATTWGLAAAR